jgi:hypothetical protein
MSTLVRPARRANRPAPRAPRAVVAASPRVDGWLERQAEAAVRAARDGLIAAPPRFDPAPPAPTPALHDGRPLPAGLRARFEAAFRADLAGVRVYDGPAAAALARSAGARAFAAGRHVVLGAGEAARADHDDLLAHEVAHVLQQVGRRGADGRLGVVDVAGAGPIQRAPITLPSTTITLTNEEILARHLAVSADPDALTAYWRALQFAIAMRGEAAVVAELAAEATLLPDAATASGRTPVTGRTASERAFVIDLLKRAGSLDAAVALTVGHDLPTTLCSDAFYQALATAYPDDVYPGMTWQADAVFAGMGPLDFGLAVLDYLLGSTLTIQRVGAGQPPLEATLATVAAPTGVLQLADGTPLNERRVAAIEAVRQLHGWQPRLLTQLAHARWPDRSLRTLTPDQRRGLAVELDLWAQGVIAHTTRIREPTEVVALAALLASLYRTVSRVALMYLDEVLGQAEWDNDARRRLQRALLASGRAEPAFVAFAADYQSRFEVVLALDSGGRVPSIAVFAAAVTALRTPLAQTLRRDFESEARRRVHAMLGVTNPDRLPQPHVYLAMARRLAELDRLLGDYDAAADRRAATELGATLGEPVDSLDLRVRTRRRIAAWVADVGGALGWTALTALATSVVEDRQVATATAAAQAESYVALTGTWGESSDSRTGRLLDDFSGTTPLRGFAPLTAGDLVAFFQRLQYDDLTRRVRTRLADPARTGSVWNDALRDGREQFVAPKRHDLDGEVVAALRASDAEQFGDLLWANPRTRAYVREADTQGERPFRLTPLHPVARAYFWSLPDLMPLVAPLRTLAFDQVILAHQQRGLAAAVATPEPAPSLTAIQALSPAAWIAALDAALNDGTAASADTTAAIAAFHRSSQTQRDASFEALRTAGRDATSDDRARRVAELVTVIAGYPGRSFDTVPTVIAGERYAENVRYAIPRLVVNAIDRFMRSVYPPEDQDLQVLAMVLELTPHLPILLGVAADGDLSQVRSLRWDIIEGLEPLLIQARDLVDGLGEPANAARRAQFLAILPAAADGGWLGRRRQRIVDMLAAFLAAQQDVQARFGMRALRPNSDATSVENYLESVGGGGSLINGHVFHHEGVRYKPIAIARSFEFHEQIGAAPARLTDLDGNTLPRSTELLTIEIGSGTARRRHVIHGSDVTQLTAISRAVQMGAIAESLRVLGEVLDTYAELLMTGLEFVPGAGQVVMLTRFALGVVQFIESGELDTILTLLRNDPVAVLTDLGHAVTSALDVDLLFQYFLFNHNHLGELGRAPARLPATAPRSRAGRLGRMVRRIWGFGRNLLGAFGRTQARTRRGVERVQGALFERRYVPRILRFVSDNLPRAAVVAELATELADDMPTLARFVDLAEDGDPVAAIAAAMDGIPARLARLLDGMSTLRLPYQLVDPTDLLHIAIDLVTRRLGGRYRLAAAGILAVLQAVGLRERIEGAIATRLAGYADPNALYRRMFGTPDTSGNVTSGPVVDALRGVRDQVVGGLLDLVGGVSFLPTGVRTSFTAAATTLRGMPLTLQFHPDGFEGEVDEVDDGDPEVEGYQARGGIGGPTPAVAGGEALPRADRHAVEARFGHDFGHVRLHRGADGAAMAGRYGAEAVTTGSHVYLGPRVQVGSDVMHHELTHVLQQTGPRPLGQRHDAAPRIGAPGRGLRYDSAREAAADRVAASVRDGVATRPVDVGGAHAHGLQPTISAAWLGRVLDLLAAPTSVAHTVESDAATSASHLSADIHTQIDGVAAAVRGRFAAAPGPAGVQYASPWNGTTAQPLVRDRITGDRWTLFASRIDDLARDATRPRAVVPGAAPPAATTVEPRDLDVEAFEAELSRHLLDVTGVLVHIEFARVAATATAAPLRLEAVRVVTVHLPLIAAQAALVRHAIDAALPAVGLRLASMSAYNSLSAERKRDLVIRNAQAQLQTLGIDASNWTTGGAAGYQLAPRVTNAMADAIRASLSEGALDPALLPPAATYAAAADQPGSQIGLRVGVYRGQRGPERESHHVTQFVLLEYFSNLHPDEQAFEHVGTDPEFYGTASGLATATGTPPQVTRVGAVHMPISVVGTNAEQRGPGMPAILLAAPTHRNAGLHIHNAPEDFVGGSVAERGSAAILRAWFHQTLRGQLRTRDGVDWVHAAGNHATSPAERATFIARRPTTQPSAAAWRATISRELELAMKRTYAHLRDFMQPRLQSGLLTAERTYYTEAALQTLPPASGGAERTVADLPPTMRLTAPMLLTAYTAAVRKNADILEGSAGGWA